ncbi:MAG TPA: hypothetical protein VMK12_15595, partial [Anaeromyxobacteraceae bacterium]|nr:hypothetical protein [Anaeromyxobacteraceae bacterium]
MLVALAFVCGALVGGVGATAAAYRASKAFMDIHRFLFTHDQVEKMRAAWKAGDMNKALSHATCAFEMTAGDAARNFDFSYVGWRWGDPRFSMDFD